MLSSGVALGDRYELEERVGLGGYSEVWRARDLTLGRPVAVKVLHPGYVEDSQALARFQAEARHAGSLSHRNIARIYDYGQPNPPYLVMELVEGPSFDQVLSAGPIDPSRAMEFVAQAADGLQAAHEAGLIHRDIKPANLLLTPDGVVKITDFGISRAVDTAGVTTTGLVLGTPGYLAPERAAGSSATALSDLYSLGVVAYECLAGEPPFNGTALEVALVHAIQPLPMLPASVPDAVEALVSTLTAKDPASRPGSAAEVARRARQLGRQLASGAPLGAGAPLAAGSPVAAGSSHGQSDPPPTRPWRAPKPRRTAVVGAVTASALALIGLVVLVAANLSSYDSGPHPGATRSASAATVDVSTQSLVDQTVSAVVSQLKRQGLVPKVVWQPSDQQQPGRVTAVWPAGPRPPGSVVTVVGALRESATTAPPGDGNGNGNGDG